MRAARTILIILLLVAAFYLIRQMKRYQAVMEQLSARHNSIDKMIPSRLLAASDSVRKAK